MREILCMVFHVRWIYHHGSPNPTLITSDSGGIRRLVVRKIHLTWKPYKIHIFSFYLQFVVNSECHSFQVCLSSPNYFAVLSPEKQTRTVKTYLIKTCDPDTNTTGEEVSIDKQVACEECPRWLKMTEVA